MFPRAIACVCARTLLLSLLMTMFSAILFTTNPTCGTELSLAEAMKKAEKIPPDWFGDVPVNYDTSKPWKDARLHIRNLLSKGGPKAKEAIKLTYIYLVEKKVQKEISEYPLYLLLGGEYAWATKAYEDFLRPKPKAYTHEYQNLASCYMRFGEPQKALNTLNVALQRLPDPPWRTMNEAKIRDQQGDIYAQLGNHREAARHYRAAMNLFSRARSPYGRHLLPRHIAKTQSKLDLLYRSQLDLRKIPDGVYRDSSLGFAKDVYAIVKVKSGHIVDIKVRHEEKIDLGATKIIPKRIIEKQDLHVDAITGATVTAQAIVEAVYRALQRGGLK